MKGEKKVRSLTDIDNDTYENPTEAQTLGSPNGFLSSLQIAGTSINKRFPKFPIFKDYKSAANKY